ncbi:MAG: type II secretion system protein M [Colwellia sp.]|nr:type II secretion system protein M [Colwellia sp.]
MKIWWQQLKTSEQRLVAIMAIVVIGFLFFSLIWQPLNEGITKAQQKIGRQQTLLTEVQEGTQRYQQAKRNGGSGQSSGSLSSIVNQSAGRHNITITRLQPQADDLQVWIDEVPFSQLLGWLEFLANREGLLVKSIDLGKTDEKGVVKVRRLQLGKS